MILIRTEPPVQEGAMIVTRTHWRCEKHRCGGMAESNLFEEAAAKPCAATPDEI